MALNRTILYFGLYDPNYARNWVLINGLKKSGAYVLELRQKPARFALFKLFFGYLKFKQDYDAMIVGFPGQEVMFLARLLVWRKPIIFDAFTSHYGGYILDRKHWGEKSLRAYYFKFLDKWSCRLADMVLLDTDAHINFFIKEFKLPKAKFRRIWIGANDENFKPIEYVRPSGGQFRAIFFGTYVPLQGAEYIVQAANILENEKDVIFQFIGKGHDKPRCIELANGLGLKNIEFTGMMKPENLKIEIAKSDVVLGLFGNTPKTPLVIPNKVYEALAMKKPVITADTPAVRELFDAEDMLLIEAANPKAISEAILKLKSNPELMSKISVSGFNKFKNSASSLVLGRRLKNIINELE